MSAGWIFAAFLLGSGAAAASGAVFKPGSWYDGLKRPRWTPPGWVFPLVWTTLYILMAWAATRVALRPENGDALALYAAQIALNTLWTPVFFGARRIGLGAVVLLALLATVVTMIPAFWRVDWFAGLLLLPYAAWLCLAAVLNLWIWRNNRLSA